MITEIKRENNKNYIIGSEYLSSKALQMEQAQVNKEFQVTGEAEKMEIASENENILLKKEKFSCKICLKHFKSGFYLGRHEMIHTGEKPFACRFCHRRFRKSCNAKEHERLHTGEKPHSCPNCHR